MAVPSRNNSSFSDALSYSHGHYQKASMADEEHDQAHPVFRISKRRRLQRQKRDDDAAAATPTEAQTPSDTVDADAGNVTTSSKPEHNAGAAYDDDDDDEHSTAFSEAMKHRRLQKSRRRKPGLAAQIQRRSSDHGESSSSLVRRDSERKADGGLMTLDRRFAPQSGLVAGFYDKHMNAFVDSEIAKLQARGPQASADSDSAPAPEPSAPRARNDDNGHRNRVTTGHLHEIDLGPAATSKNIAMTEEAARRLHSSQASQAAERPAPSPKPGKDGKAAGRKRRQRTSEDLKRDEIVEAIMKESKLDMYDEPETVPQYGDEDGAADERLAAEFQREFLEALQNRNVPRKQPAPPNVGKDQPKGPKLGGSRSARAAMHAQERAAAAKKK